MIYFILSASNKEFLFPLGGSLIAFVGCVQNKNLYRNESGVCLTFYKSLDVLLKPGKSISNPVMQSGTSHAKPG
jgi:hypothetical protein